MNATVIHGSRLKYALMLGVCLAFVAISLWLLRQPNQPTGQLQLCLSFFGFGAVVALWLLIRPQRLTLDDEGFAVSGGFIRQPKKVYWRDVDHFFIYRLPRGAKMVGYNLKPGARRVSARLNRVLGADGTLPKGWELPPEKLVEKLNGYCRRLPSGNVVSMPGVAQ